MNISAVRTVRSAALACLALGVVAAPAAAASSDNTFGLTTGSVSAYGTYDRMMSIPERPVPPVLVSGTLAVNNPHLCGVVQIGYNGPADGIEWRTFDYFCGKGKTNFRTTSDLLWGGFEPPVRLCKGTSAARAERGTSCVDWTPSTNR